MIQYTCIRYLLHHIAYTYIAKVIRYNDKKKNLLKYFKTYRENQPICEQAKHTLTVEPAHLFLNSIRGYVSHACL